MLKTISRGDYTSLSLHCGRLYGATCEMENETSAVHVFHPSTWNCTREIKLPCLGAHFHSIKVNGDGIIVGCWNSRLVYVLNSDGSVLYKHGVSGIPADVFKGPFLCHLERDGSMLVADYHAECVKVYYKNQWKAILLQQQPVKPVFALFIGNILYILGADRKLRMYKS